MKWHSKCERINILLGYFYHWNPTILFGRGLLGRWGLFLVKCGNCVELVLVCFHMDTWAIRRQQNPIRISSTLATLSHLPENVDIVSLKILFDISWPSICYPLNSFSCFFCIPTFLSRTFVVAQAFCHEKDFLKN